jgi:hypothetical protein
MRTVAVVIFLALAGCARPKPQGAQVDPALSTLIPPDTQLAITVRADRLRETPLYKKYLAGRDFPELDRLTQLTGADPRKDLWQLLYLSDLKHNIVLARGNFPDDMELKLEKQGARRMGHKSYYIVGSEEAAVVFFNSTTAAVGDVESLKALLDARSKANGPPPGIAERMKQIPADAQVWTVYTGGPIRLPFALSGNLANAKNLLTSVQAGSAWLTIGQGIQGLVRVQTASEAGAASIHDALKAAVGFGRLMSPADQPELLRVYDGFQVSREGSQVDVKIEEPPELVDKLIALLPAR